MNYFWPIAVLIISIIIFHLVFITWLPQSKTFWKKVDYYWISLGMIGIIGSSFSLTREYALASSPLHQESLKNNYQLYLTDISDLHNYYSDPNGFDYAAFPNQKKAHSFIAAGIFYDSLFRFAKRNKDFIVVKHEFENLNILISKHQKFIDTTSDKYVRDYSRSHHFLLESLNEEAKELKLLKENSERGLMNWVLLLFSPYLFAVAIAIRLTKVTAELRDLRK